MKKKLITLLLCTIVLSTVGCSKLDIKSAEYTTSKLNEGIESANLDAGHEVKPDDIDINVTMDLTKDKCEEVKSHSEVKTEDNTEKVKIEVHEQSEINDKSNEDSSTDILNSEETTNKTIEPASNDINSDSNEFAIYNNTELSGYQVSNAIAKFAGHDVAVIVQTEALANVYPDMAVNYDALITSDGKPSSLSNKPEIMLYDGEELPKYCQSSTKKDNNIITEKSKTAVVVEFGKALDIYNGDLYYNAALSNISGSVSYNYDLKNTVEPENYCYIPYASMFSATLVKNLDGSTIGVVFKEIEDK